MKERDLKRLLGFDPGSPRIVTTDDLIRLCDAHLSGTVALDTLQAAAAAILESDQLAWDETSAEGELIAEVLWEWSSPDTEGELTAERVALHRQTLAAPPPPNLTSQN